MVGALASFGTTLRNVSPLPGLAATATGHPTGHTLIAAGETGYAIPLDNLFNLAPFASLELNSDSQGAYSETGGGVLNLTVASHTTTSLRSILGTPLNGVNIPIGDTAISTELKMGWAHEYSDRNPMALESFAGLANTNFTVLGARLARDTGIVGLGLSAAIAPGAAIYLHYYGEFSSISTSNAISGGIFLHLVGRRAAMSGSPHSLESQ